MLLMAAAACRIAGASREPSGADAGPPLREPSGFADTSVILSPLTVSAAKDRGFVAATSLAGGRLSTDLRDTPLAYSVITRELIDALMLLDTESALAWSVGAYAPPTNTQNYKFFNFEGGSSVMSRGIQTNAPQRNFFLLGLNADTYSQERIDFARGPNAVLVGTSGLGGVVNGLTKQAHADKLFRTVAASVGSWRRRRTTLDLNQPIGGRAAMRVNLLWQDADGWRGMAFDQRRGIHLAGTVNPFPNTRIRAEYEFFEQRTLMGLDSVNDRVSGWDGVTVSNAPTASIANSDSKGVVRNGSATAPYLVYVPGSDPTRVLNWANTWTTTGGAANARVPVGGVPPLSNTGLGINGGAIVGSVYDPSLLFARAIAGAGFVPPDRNTIISPDAPNIIYRFHNAAAFVEHQQGDHLFFEAAVNAVDSRKTSEYLQTAGLADARIDLNATLPDGRPNPNFKQAYGEGINGHTHFDDRTTEARIAAALVFDETRWGSFRGNVIVGGRETKSHTSQTTEVLKRDADIRQRPLRDGFLYRYYWNDPVKPFIRPARVSYLDPIAGTTVDYDVDAMIDLARPGNQRFSLTRFGYVQIAGNAKLLRDRLNLIAGLRRDTFDVDTRTLNSDPAAVAHDYPADWNGRTLHYRGDAPNDYWDLTFTPKDATGTATGPAQPALARPKLNGVPLAQYANDRFREDYSSPEVSFNTNTVTYGGVAHVLPWLSVFANYAESFAPGISGLTVSGASVPPSLSEGWDVGLRFTLKDGRLSASVSRYGSIQNGNSFDSTGSTRKYADIVSANVVGDSSLNGMNKRGLPLVPIPTFDFRDRKANGYEIDVVANLTKQWRLIANAAKPEVYTTNNASDEWTYLRTNEPTLRQIVLDAGGIIDAANIATVDLTIPTADRSPDVEAAVAAWNNIQTFKATDVPGALTPTNLPNYTANVFTDYRFDTGPLSGFRIGGGLQYIGRRIIGNRGADTMIDPANPSRAIDDPSVDATTPIYRSSYYTVTGTLAYERLLRRGTKITVGLNVTNLLNEDRLVFTGTGLRATNGDITRPNRSAVPTGFNYLQPRAYYLSVRFDF